MARKKWVSNTDVTPELLKSREKRKWQIAFRRYVLERNVCFDYAPYFGLDIENIRKWFEYQFQPGIGWDDFAHKWQFNHVIPVTYFDFSKEYELKICWNFTNIRVENLELNKDGVNRMDVLASKKYFKELYEATNYKPCKLLLQKIEAIELSEVVSIESQQVFINENREYLDMIADYTAFEFELLNSGRDKEDINKELAFLKKYGK